MDVLRPPSVLDPTAPAYKDWLHVNLFEPASGAVGLFNVSLHGSPTDPRAVALGTALLHRPDTGWVGNAVVRSLAEVHLGAASVDTGPVTVALEPLTGVVHLDASLPGDGLEARLRATPAAPGLPVEVPVPFGEGWISWRVVPRLEIEGGLAVGGEKVALDRAAAYHDHNWGRWHWGQDAGWEWGVFACTAPDGPTVVVARTTDRRHDAHSPLFVQLELGGREHVFPPESVRLDYSGCLATRPRRVPGAMAGLHADRRLPRLPSRIRVEGERGDRWIEVGFESEHAAQIIAGDPARPGYGFIQEVAGRAEIRGRAEGRDFAAEARGVFEYVE